MQVCPVDAIKIYERKINIEHYYIRKWKKLL
jgi:hypothetical protein